MAATAITGNCRWNPHKRGTSDLFTGPDPDGIRALPGPQAGLYASAELAEQAILATLSWPPPHQFPPDGLDGGEPKTPAEISELTEQVLRSVAQTASVQLQEWDNAIDCIMLLPDRTMIQERISITQLSEASVREAGIRLQRKRAAIDGA